VRSKVGLSAAVLEQALERLTASGKLHRTNEIIRVAGRAEEIPEPRRRQMDAVEKLYAEAGLAPPLLSEVAVRLGSAPAAMREVITFLLRSKQLVRMGSDDAFVHTDTLTKLYSDLRLHRGETFDVGRFKLFTGLTRKHAIPLLEHLDQVRVTRNNSGVRTVL
jgi:selenocysteine-specific elongation factor